MWVHFPDWRFAFGAYSSFPSEQLVGGIQIPQIFWFPKSSSDVRHKRARMEIM